MYAKPYTSKTTLSLKPSQLVENQPGEAPPTEFVPIPPPKKKLSKPKSPVKLRRKKFFPKHAPPRSLLLPFVKVSDDVANKSLSYIETDSFTRHNIMRMMRRRLGRQADAYIPGWLVELSDARLNGIMDIRETLEATSSPPLESEVDDNREALIATLHSILTDKMSLEITKEEITDTLFGVRADDTKPVPFSDFVFGVANLEYARQSGIIKPRAKGNKCFEKKGPTRMECYSTVSSAGETGDNGSQYTQSRSSSKSTKTRSTVSVKSGMSRSYSNPFGSGYNEREKVLYSGLLVCQMFDTLQSVERLYFQTSLPSTAQKKKAAGKGFELENLGFQKIGEAAWDRVPFSPPKSSPYLTVVPFVGARWKVLKPNRDEKGRRRTLNELRPIHLAIKPPHPRPFAQHHRIEFRDPIRVTENSFRIKQTLDILAAKGDCIALLPDIHHIIHLSDTFVERLEEVSMKPLPKPVKWAPRRRSHPAADIALIMKDAHELDSPFGYPRFIERLKYRITFMDGIRLRYLMDRIREQHWEYIKEIAKTFGHNCWNRMGADRMNEGMIKNSFTNCFLTYLPYTPRLPASEQPPTPF